VIVSSETSFSTQSLLATLKIGAKGTTSQSFPVSKRKEKKVGNKATPLDFAKYQEIILIQLKTLVYQHDMNLHYPIYILGSI